MLQDDGWGCVTPDVYAWAILSFWNWVLAYEHVQVLQSFISRSKCCVVVVFFHQCNFRFNGSSSGCHPLTLSLIMSDWWDKACSGSVRRILLCNMIYWCPWWHQWRTFNECHRPPYALKERLIQQVSCINCLPTSVRSESSWWKTGWHHYSNKQGHNLTAISRRRHLSPWYYHVLFWDDQLGDVDNEGQQVGVSDNSGKTKPSVQCQLWNLARERCYFWGFLFQTNILRILFSFHV